MDSQTRRVKAHERHLQALELRKAGATFQQIATQLGYADAAGAHKAVMSALRATLREPADELRTLEAERLDALQLALWKRALAGEERAVARVVNLMARRARLLGLDAPQRSELSALIDTVSARDLNLKGLTDAELIELDRLIAKLDATAP